MKFDTITILLVVFIIGFVLFIAKDYEKKGSFAETIQVTLGLIEKDNGPKPEDTLVAMWADPDVKPLSGEERGDASLPVNKIPLEKPHRTQRYIAEWLTQHVGNALDLRKDKISKLNTAIGPSFTPTGLEEYKAFGKDTNIFSAVFHGDKTTLATYSKSSPLFIAGGPVGGVYEWTYELEMVLNLVKGELKQYKGNTAEQQHKDVFFCVTVKRVNEAMPDGIQIDHWKTGRCSS